VDLVSNAVFNDFILSYMEENREGLILKYPHAETFELKFNVNKKIMDQFLRFAENKNIRPDESEQNQSFDLIKTQIKALIARNLYDIHAFHKNIQTADQGFKTAIRILEDEKYYSRMIGR
jgi:carboxyl-terminal processing protease